MTSSSYVMSRLARQRTPGLMWTRTPARSLLTMVLRRCNTTLSFSVYPVLLGLLRSLSGTAHSALVRIYVYMEGYIDIGIYFAALERPKSYSTDAINKIFKDKN